MLTLELQVLKSKKFENAKFSINVNLEILGKSCFDQL